MKKKLWRVFVCALACCGMMTFAACSEPDNSQNNVVKPVYLDKIITENYGQTGNPNIVITLYNTWEQGRLVKQQQETKIMLTGEPQTSVTSVFFSYTEGRCTEIKYENSVLNFTYDAEGRLISGVRHWNNGEIETVTVKSFSPEGDILQMERIRVDGNITEKFISDLTWKDGDLVKYTIHTIEPVKKDVTVENTFASYPSQYMGYPLAQSLIDGPESLAERASKHCRITTDKEYFYENGRMTMYKAGNNAIYFSYTDGTGKIK
jgi:YD repeat-containing protein